MVSFLKILRQEGVFSLRKWWSLTHTNTFFGQDDHDTTSVSDEPLGSHSVVDDYHHHHDDDDNAVDRHFADADNDMALPQDDYDEEDDGNDQPCGRKKKAQFRKSRDAPKRFKSPYICFFTAKQEEIREELGEKAPVTEIAKRSAERWKELSSEGTHVRVREFRCKSSVAICSFLCMRHSLLIRQIENIGFI